MAVEVQIRETVLAQAFMEHVQTQLFTMCLPGIPTIYADHLDTVPGSLAFSDSDHSGIQISLKIVLYVVGDAEVKAHPNGSPPGASQPLGEIAVLIIIGMQGAVLRVISATSDSSGLPPPPMLRTTVKAAIDTALSSLDGLTLLDAAPIVTALAAVVPASPDLVRGSGFVAIRFGSAGPLVPQLAPDQAFGAFLDGNEATALLIRRLPAGLPINVRWMPNGSTPAIGMDFNFEVSPLGIDVASITAAATGRVSLELPATLKLAVSWTLDLGGVIDLLEPMARKLVRQFIRQQVKSTLPGAVHDGAQSFHFTIALPTVPTLLGAQPLWGSISSNAAGMTIGGPVVSASPGRRETLWTRVDPFGKPTWWGRCRERARAGDGSPPTEFEEAQLTVHGGVSLGDAGALCSAEILSPNQWLMNHTTPRLTGMGFTLPIAVAEKITKDVRILIRTARGSRFIDLGKPRIVRDEDGKLADVQRNWIPDCLMLTGAMLKLATGARLTVDDLKPRPLEEPNWMRQLGVERGVNSHILTISGLEPGEMVTLIGTGINIDITANDAGFATVPAFVGLSSTMSETIVQRLSGRRFSGVIRIQTLEFNWLAAVGPADAAAVSDYHGRARVSRRMGDTVVVEDYLPNEMESFIRVDPRGETFLNPQPLPPSPPDALRLAAEAGLEDIETALFQPGTVRGDPVIVRMRDGSGLVVVTDGRRARVAGRYAGPLVGMLVDGGFAVAVSGGLLHLFSVCRPEDVTFNR